MLSFWERRLNSFIPNFLIILSIFWEGGIQCAKAAAGGSIQLNEAYVSKTIKLKHKPLYQEKIMHLPTFLCFDIEHSIIIFVF